MKKYTKKLAISASAALVVAIVGSIGALALNRWRAEAQLSPLEVAAHDETANVPDRPAYDYRTEFNGEEVVKGTMNLSVSGSYEDSTVLQKGSDYIALVRIDSLDGAMNYAEVTNSEVTITSFGKMTILKNLKGDLGSGVVKTFYRPGGTMNFDEYCQHANQAHCGKIQSLNTERKAISMSVAGDIELEVGKTYLAYLMKDEILRDTEGYTFVGFQGGLREIQTASTGYSVNSNPSEVKVLNNFTGEWENLSNVVKQDK